MKVLNPYKFLFFFMFVLGFGQLSAQNQLNTAEIEQKSYQLYTDKNWSELIPYVKKALHEGIDYFYLRMRIGIAYYERKNYNLAELHFRKALGFNSTDELAQEYLYYCYVFTGNNNQARVLSRKLSEKLKEKIGIQNQNAVEFINLEGGTKISDSSAYYNKGTKSRTNFFRPPIYLQLGLNHYVNNKISIYHALTFFSQNSSLGNTRQIQYYIKASIPIKKKNWLISPSFHYVHLHTSQQFIPPHNPNMPPPKPQITVDNSGNYVGSIAIQKSFRKWTASVGTTISYISGTTQYLHSGFLSYNILGNSKVVLGCTGYLHSSDNYSSLYTSASPFIYYQPVPKLSFKASCLLNKGNNIIEENGYLVNNSRDFTKSRWSLLANYTAGKHVGIYALYQLELKKEAVQLFNYQYHVLLAGLKITL